MTETKTVDEKILEQLRNDILTAEKAILAAKTRLSSLERRVTGLEEREVSEASPKDAIEIKEKQDESVRS